MTPNEPEKRKLDHEAHAGQPNFKSNGHLLGYRDSLTASASRSDLSKLPQRSRPSSLLPLKPAPSNVLAKLASQNNQSKDTSPTDNITRSSAFAEKPVPQPDLNAVASMRRPDDVIDAPTRDNRLALIEDLEVGPIDHKPPFDDPHFQQLEPNSGIRLSWVFK